VVRGRSLNFDFDWRVCRVTGVQWAVHWAVVSRLLWWRMMLMACERCSSCLSSVLQMLLICLWIVDRTVRSPWLYDWVVTNWFLFFLMQEPQWVITAVLFAIVSGDEYCISSQIVWYRFPHKYLYLCLFLLPFISINRNWFEGRMDRILTARTCIIIKWYWVLANYTCNGSHS